MISAHRPLTFITTLAAVMTVTTGVMALPAVGQQRPDLRLTDAWDRSLSVPKSSGRPLLLVYEDKDSATQNKEFKDELAELAKGDRYRNAVTLLAVADVDGYDFWPISGRVKDAIKRESTKAKTTIYCDWDGAVRKATGVRRGTSSVVLYAADGKVLIAHEGPMSKADREKVFALLRALLPSTAA